MKRIIVAALTLPVFLVGCGSPAVSEDGNVNEPESSIYGKVDRIEVDGVDCVIYDADGGGGSITCDWDSAVQQ